jgi:MoxR-like ATPase
MRFIKPNKKVPIDLSILNLAEANTSAQPENETMKKPKQQKDFVPNRNALKQTISLFEDVFDNMKNKRDFKQFAGLILTGNPGGGKTSKITLLAKLLGVELITVEAPHLIEEHIIHIPFLVRDPVTDKDETGTTTVKFDKFKVVLSDSNLFSKIKTARPITDEQYLQMIYKSSQDVIELFEALGGSKTEVPSEIEELRKTYTTILFFDEYFRQTSTRIRNLLRGILNGKIGTHDIPPHAYVIYATNLHDAGVDEIPLNTQFGEVEVKAPSKDEWFSYLVFKFQHDKKVQLNKSLINKFYDELKDEHLDYDDMVNEVRTSPRRWEQLLLYINSGLQNIKSEEDAKSLLTNVAINFKNYLTGAQSDIAVKVLKVTADLIKEVSGFEIAHTDVNSASDWRKTLKHQIEMKQQLGDYRKYVPVLSGLPGVAKTTGAHKLAHDLDLRFIDIDVSTINAEDAVGLPIANQTGDDKIETNFSLPSLYQYIMEQIKKKDKLYLEEMKKKHPDDFEVFKKEYESRPYKYLIFFDEFNRTSTKVFNAIRQVLLEKHFGSANEGKGKKLELPKEAIVLAAINPHDVGAEELTSHMRDVLDIVEVGSDWKHTLKYLNDQKIPGADETTHEIVMDVIKRFGEKWATKDRNIRSEERPFHFDLGQDVYISPREYTQLYIAVTRKLDREFKKLKKIDISDYSPAQLKKLEKELRESIYEAIATNTRFIFTKHNKGKEEFYQDLKAWILHDPDLDFGENLFYKKAYNKNSSSLVDMLEKHFSGEADNTASENSQFINYMKNVDINKFAEDFRDVIADTIHDKASAEKYLFKDDFARKTLNAADKTIETDSEKVCLLENFIREILYALYLNDFSYDKIEATFYSMREILDNMKADESKGIDDDLLAKITDKNIEVGMRLFDVIDEEIPKD